MNSLPGRLMCCMTYLLILISSDAVDTQLKDYFLHIIPEDEQQTKLS